jgi:hypothetical protein
MQNPVPKIKQKEWQNACLAITKPWVQTSGLPKEKRKK